MWKENKILDKIKIASYERVVIPTVIEKGVIPTVIEKGVIPTVMERVVIRTIMYSSITWPLSALERRKLTILKLMCL